MKKKRRGLLLVIIMAITFPLLTAFTTSSPRTLYRVYLKGKSIGLIESKTELENYIDKKQNQIKEKFDVDKVYLPQDLDIVKETTFDNNISSVEKIYKKIENISPFTIRGYEITITGVDQNQKMAKK